MDGVATPEAAAAGLPGAGRLRARKLWPSKCGGGNHRCDDTMKSYENLLSSNDVGPPRIEFLPMSIFILSDEQTCSDGTCLSNPPKVAAVDIKPSDSGQ